jgi:HD-like signal output (HDOD) protein
MLTILRLLSLKNSFSKSLDLESYWETATEVAELTASVSKEISSGITDDAYSLGMMHNCGIPMMMEAIKGYQVFIDTVDTSTIFKWLDAENEVFGMNHIQISYEISTRWLMPKNVTDAILLQSRKIKDLDLVKHDNESVNFLLCSLILAKDISTAYSSHWNINDAQHDLSELKPILSFVGISETDYLDMREEHIQRLSAKN